MAADGYDWYRAVAEASEACTEYGGWIAAGDGEDAWLARREVPCPDAPVELADVPSQESRGWLAPLPGR